MPGGRPCLPAGRRFVQGWTVTCTSLRRGTLPNDDTGIVAVTVKGDIYFLIMEGDDRIYDAGGQMRLPTNGDPGGCTT
jgi:hypothetical protein